MNQPPKKKVTSPELRRLVLEKCSEKLKMCKKVPWRERLTPPTKLYALGTVTIGYECFDSDGSYIGLVFYYKHPNGQLSEPSPKEFLIDGVWHYV